MKASDLFVKCLEEEGIEYIFGVPGEENADFMISLEESARIRFILTRHEQGAAFMAEIYGRLTRTEKPGAVHIELPEDIAKHMTTRPPMNVRKFRRSVPDDKVVDRAFDKIKQARRPLIIAGNGCIRRRARKQLRILCDKTGIGVVSTFMAKGCVDMDADYCLYTIGLGSRDFVQWDSRCRDP